LVPPPTSQPPGSRGSPVSRASQGGDVTVVLVAVALILAQIVAEFQGFEPFLSCLKCDIAENIWKYGVLFYPSKDKFGSIPISVVNILKSIGVFREN